MKSNIDYKILIIEDDLTALLIMSKVVSGQGYKIHKAQTIAESKLLLDENVFDAVFLDVLLPDGNGFDILDYIRNELGKDTPVVMMTGLNDPECIEKAFQLGATDFITKPIVFDLIPHKLKYILKAYHDYKLLGHSESFNRALVDAVPDVLLVFDNEGNIIKFTSSLYGICPEAKVGDPTIEAILGDENAAFIYSEMADFLPGSVTSYMMRVEHSGEQKSFEVRLSDVANGSFVCFIRDFTARVNNENSLQLYKSIFNNSDDSIVLTDINHVIIDCNKATERFSGYSREELMGSVSQIFRSEMHREGYFKRVWSTVLKNGSWSGEVFGAAKDGRLLPAWLTINTIKDNDGKPSKFVGVVHDISVLKEKEKKLEEAAFTDFLTGLPNRSYGLKKLDYLLRQCERENSSVGLMYIDLDDFKVYNDTLGHGTGDKLIISLAERLQAAVRGSDLVCRIGGDEFVAIFPMINRTTSIVDICSRMISTIMERVEIDGHVILPSASIGVAMFPQDGRDSLTLMKNADLAMYKAKNEGGGKFLFYTSELSVSLEKYYYVNHLVNINIKNNLYHIFLQPIYNADGNIVSMEALTRMSDQGKILMPNGFIPYIEDNDTINMLTVSLVERLVDMQSEMLSEGIRYPVSINIPPNFLNAERHYNKMLDILSAVPELFGMINLEITENALIKSSGNIAEKIKRFKELGCRIYLDDFGTGYSSIRYLQFMPIDVIKIDKSFVCDIDNNIKNYNLCKTIIDMAKTFNLKVIAEGVETSEQAKMLTSLGCDNFQGYYFMRPKCRYELMGELAGSKGSGG